MDLKNPRKEINKLVQEKDLEQLLKQAGKFHGHYCPGLSWGVMAAAYALNELDLKSDGMENIVAIVETNSCFADGIQFVTGCTFGNNELIYRDYGKTAVTLVERETGKGIRYLKKDKDFLEQYPRAEELFEKVIEEREGTKEEEKELKEKWVELAFTVLEVPKEEFFHVQKVSPELPDYAPIFEDAYCCICQEKIMEEKALEEKDETYCIPCANAQYLQLDGSGLSVQKG